MQVAFWTVAGTARTFDGASRSSSSIRVGRDDGPGAGADAGVAPYHASREGRWKLGGAGGILGLSVRACVRAAREREVGGVRARAIFCGRPWRLFAQNGRWGADGRDVIHGSAEPVKNLAMAEPYVYEAGDGALEIDHLAIKWDSPVCQL